VSPGKDHRLDRTDLPGASALAFPDLGLGGEIRSRPEDFRVSEELGFEPHGSGEHCLLRLRKTSCNTMWVVRCLARSARVPQRDIGFSGLKDRHAVTDQWFSLPAGKANSLDHDQLREAGLEVLQQSAHRKKLRRGSHAANRFRIVLRNVTGDRAKLPARMEDIQRLGVPNFFGPQRFGRNNNNLCLAKSLAAGARIGRAERGFALSAARALIFNELLSRRVAAKTWDRLQAGDAAGLSGSRSFFLVEAVDSVIGGRLACGDIHPTGALWGKGELHTSGDVEDFEQSVAGEYPDLCQCLVRHGLVQERRHLRLMPDRLDWQVEELAGYPALTLEFALPAGAFATSVLREIVTVTDNVHI
jgi:tRNA pseudouridine13 synthase